MIEIKDLDFRQWTLIQGRNETEGNYSSFGTETLYKDRVPSHPEHRFRGSLVEREVGMTDLSDIHGIGAKLDGRREFGDRHAGIVNHAFVLRVGVTKRTIDRLAIA